jgi:hypothetical protein
LACLAGLVAADSAYRNVARRINLAPAAAATPSYKSCIASIWNLDDNAANTTVVDSGPENRTGTAAANTSTKSVSGVIGTALDFNGSSDSVLIGDYYRFAPGTNFSISFWVYSRLVTALGDPIAKYDASVQGWLLQLIQTNYASSAGSFYSDPGGRVHLDFGSNANPIPTQRWTFVVFTYQQDSTKACRFYTNAVLKASSSPAFAMPNSAANLYLGRMAHSTLPQWYNGRLDQVCIWTNKVLTALEITNLYNNGSGVTLP